MKPVRIFLLFLFLSMSIVPFCQQDTTKASCNVLKKGKFRYLDSQDTTDYVVIEGDKHTEYHNKGKYYIKSDVTWVNDCEYNMVMTKITIPDFPFKPGDSMNVKIERIEDDIIYYTSTVKGASWSGRFRILKE